MNYDASSIKLMLCLTKISSDIHKLHELATEYPISQKSILDIESHLHTTIKNLQEEIISSAVKQDFLSLVHEMKRSMNEQSKEEMQDGQADQQNG